MINGMIECFGKCSYFNLLMHFTNTLPITELASGLCVGCYFTNIVPSTNQSLHMMYLFTSYPDYGSYYYMRLNQYFCHHRTTYYYYYYIRHENKQNRMKL